MKLFVTLVFISASFLSYSQDIKAVLFFGNSYTYANDLPNTTRLLARSLGDSLTSQTSAGGGQRLSGHAADPNSYALMQSQPWDFIVLQEQSQLPSFPISQVQSDVFPYAKQLCDSIRLLPNCVKPLFFMTWGRENGDQQNCQFYPPLCTYEGMQLELRKNYLQMGLDNDAYVSPVGMVWREVRNRLPQVKLYTSDGSHPNQAGTYVAACTFYAGVFGKSPVGASYKGGLSAAIADSIQLITEQIVFDSIQTWNMQTTAFIADFNFSTMNDTVTFNYNGPLSADVSWEYGDGQSDTGRLVTHIYGTADTFKVRMKVLDYCERSVISKSVMTEVSGSTIIPDFRYTVNYDTVSYSYTGSRADSVKWDFGNGGIGIQMNDVQVYGVADTFDVTVTAYSGSAMDSITKKVVTKVKDTLTSSISLVENNQIKLYPNPSFRELNIDSKFLIKSIQLIDLTGRIIRKYENIFEFKFVISNKGELNGNYILFIETNDSTIKQNVSFKAN